MCGTRRLMRWRVLHVRYPPPHALRRVARPAGIWRWQAAACAVRADGRLGLRCCWPCTAPVASRREPAALPEPTLATAPPRAAAAQPACKRGRVGGTGPGRPQHASAMQLPIHCAPCAPHHSPTRRRLSLACHAVADEQLLPQRGPFAAPLPFAAAQQLCKGVTQGKPWLRRLRPAGLPRRPAARGGHPVLPWA